MEFSEVREYQCGDDIRSIDWNVSARLNKPFVKVFEEERELTVMLLVDMSGSQDFGTVVKKKREIAAELCACGIDYLVVGRPITSAADPAAAYLAFRQVFA